MSFSLRSPVAREWISQQREKVKPWSEFMDVAQLKKPESPQELKKIILKNIEVYHANYMVRVIYWIWILQVDSLVVGFLFFYMLFDRTMSLFLISLSCNVKHKVLIIIGVNILSAVIRSGHLTTTTTCNQHVLCHNQRH